MCPLLIPLRHCLSLLTTVHWDGSLVLRLLTLHKLLELLIFWSMATHTHPPHPTPTLLHPGLILFCFYALCVHTNAHMCVHGCNQRTAFPLLPRAPRVQAVRLGEQKPVLTEPLPSFLPGLCGSGFRQRSNHGGVWLLACSCAVYWARQLS